VRKVAVIGAGGFVGARIVEMFHLGEFAEVRPVVRRFGSLARVSRFELDCRMADARDEGALREAFVGCDAVVHTAVGDEKVIESVIEPVWKACAAAKVRRLVYLSSGSVHNQAPAVGTDESSPLSDKQWNWYNNAKVRAEQKLEKLRAGGGVELVVLRPTVVFGPRSRWIWDAARTASDGEIKVVNEGAGICNSIFVDNLVHAIGLAIESEKAVGETCLVGDEESVTWRDLYAPIAKKFGATISSVAARARGEKSFDLVSAVRGVGGAQKLLPLAPDRLKKAVKGAWQGWSERPKPSRWKIREPKRVELSVELNELQQCAWRLPHAKAARLLGYKAPVSFGEGMERSLAWLDFAAFGGIRW
jgi:2-alkyl-3-oxoalkanoate reductase